MTSQRLRPGLPLGPGSLRLQAILQDAKDTAVSTALPLVDKVATPTQHQHQWFAAVPVGHSGRNPFCGRHAGSISLTGTRSAVSGDWPVDPRHRQDGSIGPVSAVAVCPSDPAPSWCRPAPTRSADVKRWVRLTTANGPDECPVAETGWAGGQAEATGKSMSLSAPMGTFAPWSSWSHGTSTAAKSGMA